jgi:segregation and condensation protein B
MNSSAQAASSTEADIRIDGSTQTQESGVQAGSDGAELTPDAIREAYGAALESQDTAASSPGDAQTGALDANLPEGELGAGDSLSDEEILSAVTALVFASPEPIAARRLAALLENPAGARIEAALASVRERLSQSGLPLELREIAGGFQILTTPEMGETIQRLFKARKAERISPAALETLAVVAYRQPVTKAEIEAIRGVQGGPILRTLIDRGLVRVAGHADVPGHPLLYATTREFLERFGLASLGELPRDAELTKD